MNENIFFVVVQLYNHVWPFSTPWTVALQAFLYFTIYQSLLKFISIESLMPSNHLILCRPLLFLPSIFPNISVFLNGFASGSQSVGASASASVLPMNIQNWFPLGWTGWISLLSKGLSRVFSNTTIQKHKFFSAQLLHSPTLTSIRDYWKNHRFDYMDLRRQRNFSAF